MVNDISHQFFTSSCFRLPFHARFRPPISATQRNFVVDWKVFSSPHTATCEMSRIPRQTGCPALLPRISTSSELLFRCAATRRSDDQFNPPIVVRHRHALEEYPKHSELCQVSGRNSGWFNCLPAQSADRLPRYQECGRFDKCRHNPACRRSCLPRQNSCAPYWLRALAWCIYGHVQNECAVYAFDRRLSKPCDPP